MFRPEWSPVTCVHELKDHGTLPPSLVVFLFVVFYFNHTSTVLYIQLERG